MKNIPTLSVIVLYLLILFLQYNFLEKEITESDFDDEHKKLDQRIEYNNNNVDFLKKNFLDILNERINLLHSGKLNYNDWIEYNKKNVMIDIDGKPYYIFIYDQLDKDDQIITKVHVNPKFTNLSWKDVIKSISEGLLFTKYSTDEQLINNMFKLSKKGSNDIEYYWVDPLTNIPIKKHSFFNRFYDKTSGNIGIVGMGFDTADLNSNERYRYINVIHLFYAAVCSFLTIFITILILQTDMKTYTILTYFKAITFLLFTNLYIFVFLNTIEPISSSTNEIEKIKGIRSDTLSISFLTGVNTFILTKFSEIKAKENSLYFQNTLLFGTGIFMLLLSIIKYTTYTNITDIITDRISLQLTFNFCVIVNMLILFNYTSYFLFNKVKFHKFFKI